MVKACKLQHLVFFCSSSGVFSCSSTTVLYHWNSYLRTYMDASRVYTIKCQEPQKNSLTWKFLRQLPKQREYINIQRINNLLLLFLSIIKLLTKHLIPSLIEFPRTFKIEIILLLQLIPNSPKR